MKHRYLTSYYDFNQCDVNCWKRGYFQLNDIYNDYDTRLEITDEILSMVDHEKYVIIFGDSHYGKSTLLKRLIIGEGGLFFLSKLVTDPMDESMHLLLPYYSLND